MKKLFFLFFLTSGCFYLGDMPKDIELTEQEKEWQEKIQNDFPYKITLFKGQILDECVMIQDSTFDLYISLSDTITNYPEKWQEDVHQISQSYSTIRDFKNEVKYLRVSFMDRVFKRSFTYKYDIDKDTLISY